MPIPYGCCPFSQIQISHNFVDLQTLAQLLYKAADDGDVNPRAVFNILKVERGKAEDATGVSRGAGSATTGAGQSKYKKYSLMKQQLIEG